MSLPYDRMQIGIVGKPNVGKSTFFSAATMAPVEIANYPFTTIEPNLGVANMDDETSLILADIPGLIEGSYLGKGLGDRFLRHVERTRILVHVIDMSGFEARDPLEDYRKINTELKNYSKNVWGKTQIIVANKMDLPGAAENLGRFRKTFKKRIVAISALKKEGLEELIEAIGKKL